MDILQLIDRLEELFNAAKAVPFTHNVVVDEDRMLELIDQMRIAIPEEVKKAQQVMAQRDRVMAQAQEEANRTLQLSRDKADQLVQKDMIVQEAQRRADQIIGQARAEAEATRVDADNYVVDTLMQLQDQISKLSGQVSNGIRMVQEDQMRKASSTGVSENEGSIKSNIPVKCDGDVFYLTRFINASLLDLQPECCFLGISQADKDPRAQKQQPDPDHRHGCIECICIIHAAPGMSGPHRILNGQCKQPKQNGRCAASYFIFIGFGFRKVHALPDDGNFEEQENGKREKRGVYHHIHRHGLAAQHARSIDVESAQRHACNQCLDAHKICIRCAFDEFDGRPNLPNPNGNCSQHEEDVQPLVWN